MADTKEKENFIQRERRQKARKSVYKETYKKGVFIDKEQIIKWLNQDDILVRVNAGGKLNDNSEYIQITIEGFDPDK